MPDLSTTYLGLRLRSPLVASASPLCEDIDNIRRMEDAGVGAVVWAGARAGVEWTPGRVGLAALAVTCAAAIVFGVLLLSAAFTFVTKASTRPPFAVVSNAPAVAGKSVEPVVPAT